MNMWWPQTRNPKKPDAQDGVDHGLVSEHRLARERGEQLRGHAHARQDGNVDFGVAEEPEQMLPEQRRATAMLEDLVRSHESAGNKELVPAVRSSSNRTPAASSTAKPSSPRMAVTSQVQHVSGMRIRLMPLHRRSTVVAMKLIAPISEAPQKIAILIIHRVCPIPSPGPDRRPTALRGRVGRPARKRRAALHEEGGHHHAQGEQRGPERQHVSTGNAISSAPIWMGRK